MTTAAARRLLRHAAALLERTARDLHNTHTVNGKWDSGFGAKREHNDLLATARALRELARKK